MKNLVIDKNKKYMLFFDLDFTIAVGNTPMSEKVITALNAAKEKGHKIFVNTGRAFASVNGNITNPVKWDGIIASCGEHIVLNGKTVYTKRMSKNLVDELSYKCLASNQNLILEGEEAIVKIHLTDKHGLPARYFCNTKEEYDKLMSENDFHFNKITFIGVSPDWIYEYKELSVIKHFGYEETSFVGFSKASGIEKLHEFINFEDELTISFGDSNNDLEMLEKTAISVVMGQAEESIKKLGTYITTSFENDGVADFINNYLL